MTDGRLGNDERALFYSRCLTFLASKTMKNLLEYLKNNSPPPPPVPPPPPQPPVPPPPPSQSSGS